MLSTRRHGDGLTSLQKKSIVHINNNLYRVFGYIMEREQIGAAVLAFVAGVVSVGYFILLSSAA